MKTLQLITIFTLLSYSALAQVGISNTDPKASLDVTASNAATPSITDGILIPRIDNFPSTNPGVDQDGMLVFVTGNGTPLEGFYYWDQGTTTWVTVGGAGIQKIDELTDGKSDNDGSQDGSSIFLGINAGAADDSSDNGNVGVGYQALQSNTSGYSNIGIGWNALLNNTAGRSNTAVGYVALESNVLGNQNVAIGQESLQSNSNGSNNVGAGTYTLRDNSSGSDNTALGHQALRGNIAGYRNTSVGMQTLFNNDGNNNTALGYRSLFTNNSGNQNTAIGQETLNSNLSGSNNVALGYNAGFSNSSGSGNVFLGNSAGSAETGSNKLYIDNSNADANNALIYGEFDNDILRTNGVFQVGDPTGTGYSLPASDGTANQVLATDGSGQLSFVNGGTDLSSFALAKMSLSLSQVLPISTYTKVNFDTAVFDLNSNFNTTTDRFEVTENGYYRIDASFAQTANHTTTGLFIIAIYVNGSPVKFSRYSHHSVGSIHRSVQNVVQLSVGDFIEVYAFGNSAITITNSTQYSSFEVERIR